MNSLDTNGILSDEKDLAHESDKPRNMSEMFHQNGYTGMPYVEIIEQPAPKALRFRYECEGRSAGSIPGKNSSPENKTYPTIKIHNFKGNAVIIVSCVTKDEPYRAHPHNLVGKEGCKNGICTVEVEGDNMTVAFPNLGIQCVKKKDIEQALKLREKIKVDPFQQKFAHMNQPSSIDLNSVRLCFQVFLRDSNNKKILHVPAPVVSDPIDDKKAKSDLIITKLSHTSAPAKSRQEIILLCEKVAKEDIEIHFFEKAANGEIIWSKPAEFAPGHVHKQVAISFRTPIYDREIEVSSKVQVYIELKRPSDGAKSEPYPFHFTAEDKSGITFKRKRINEEEYVPGVDNTFMLNPQPVVPYIKTEPNGSPTLYPNSPRSSHPSPNPRQIPSPTNNYQGLLQQPMCSDNGGCFISFPQPNHQTGNDVGWPNAFGLTNADLTNHQQFVPMGLTVLDGPQENLDPNFNYTNFGCDVMRNPRTTSTFINQGTTNNNPAENMLPTGVLSCADNNVQMNSGNCLINTIDTEDLLHISNSVSLSDEAMLSTTNSLNNLSITDIINQTAEQHMRESQQKKT